MKFDQMVNQLLEAKGTKPGERFHRAKESEGPGGISASPIGRDSYNPETPERKSEKPDQADISTRDFKDIVRMTSKAISLLKNSDYFNVSIREPIKKYKKGRLQISDDQEKILKSHPAQIQKLSGKIENLKRDIIIARSKENHKRIMSASTDDWEIKIEMLEAQLQEKNDELEEVYENINQIISKHEEMSEDYSELAMEIIRSASKLLLKDINQSLDKEPEKQKFDREMRPDELNYSDVAPEEFEENLKNDITAQINLLETLMEEGSNNPMTFFFEMAQKRYDETKDYAFQIKNGDNYSITPERLYRTTPFYQFISYFHNVILKAPKISLNKNQQKKMDDKIGDDSVLNKLKTVKTEKEYEKIKTDVIQYISDSSISDDLKNSLISIANGPFMKRGIPVTTKLYSSLKSSLNESFDQYASNVLQNYTYDEDDFKLDLMEILETRSKN